MLQEEIKTVFSEEEMEERRKNALKEIAIIESVCWPD